MIVSGYLEKLPEKTPKGGRGGHFISGKTAMKNSGVWILESFGYSSKYLDPIVPNYVLVSLQ